MLIQWVYDDINNIDPIDDVPHSGENEAVLRGERSFLLGENKRKNWFPANSPTDTQTNGRTDARTDQHPHL